MTLYIFGGYMTRAGPIIARALIAAANVGTILNDFHRIERLLAPSSQNRVSAKRKFRNISRGDAE